MIQESPSKATLRAYWWECQEYDAADNPVATVDGNEHRTELKYDELNRQVKQVDLA